MGHSQEPTSQEMQAPKQLQAGGQRHTPHGPGTGRGPSRPWEVEHQSLIAAALQLLSTRGLHPESASTQGDPRSRGDKCLFTLSSTWELETVPAANPGEEYCPLSEEDLRTPSPAEAQRSRAASTVNRAGELPGHDDVVGLRRNSIGGLPARTNETAPASSTFHHASHVEAVRVAFPLAARVAGDKRRRGSGRGEPSAGGW